MHTIKIQMETEELPHDFRTNNETYTIRVNASGIFANAHNSFGVARALATLAQLVRNVNYQSDTYQI